MAAALFLPLRAGKKLHLAMMAGVVTSYLGPCGLVEAGDIRRHDDMHLSPTGRGKGEHDASGEVERRAARFATTSTNGILYHGGPIMPGTVNIYYIWYGPWNTATDTTQALLTDFAKHIGGTPYFNINKSYYDATNATVSGAVNFGGATHDLGSQGTVLTDAAVQKVVANMLTSNSLPTDPNGVYFVLTSKEVKETSGFCTQYCGWHTYGTIKNKNIKYSFVGNPQQQCPSACSAQSVSPNNNLGADAMASIIAHELAESVTDPNFNAWFDQHGEENADKCAWTYGATKVTRTGAHYNVTWVDRTTAVATNWLLQQNWLNASGGKCAVAN